MNNSGRRDSSGIVAKGRLPHSMTSKDASQMLQSLNHLDKVKKHTLCLIGGRISFLRAVINGAERQGESFMQASRSIEGQKHHSRGVLQPFVVLVT